MIIIENLLQIYVVSSFMLVPNGIENYILNGSIQLVI